MEQIHFLKKEAKGFKEIGKYKYVKIHMQLQIALMTQTDDIYPLTHIHTYPPDSTNGQRDLC